MHFTAYDSPTKAHFSLTQRINIRLTHWDSRKTILKLGTVIQVVGTVESTSATDADNFWIFKTDATSAGDSPKKGRKAFAIRVKREPSSSTAPADQQITSPPVSTAPVTSPTQETAPFTLPIQASTSEKQKAPSKFNSKAKKQRTDED